MRISQVNNIQYKLSYLMASSMTGKKLTPEEEGSEQMIQEPLDMQVNLNITLNQFPSDKQKMCKKDIQFSANRGKFLQFTKDMSDAVEMMENMK